jgi:NADH-quinone oxidoreductase subunit G
MRTDIRRGKTLRRLAGDDDSVNEEWNCDKGRWAFKYLSSRERVATPMVRGADGELHEASWPEAMAAAAAGLKGKRVGVIVGGRATVEDAYGYSKFARVALGTNDIDFRAREHSEEERDFLASVVTESTTTYKDIDKADQVVLLGFEPEDESPIVFLRIYKQVRKRALKVSTDSALMSRGSKKLNAKRIASLTELQGLTSKSVLLIGERLCERVGALSAAVEIAEKTGAKLAWIPRRAGERGALQAGAIANLLPGARPVSDASARVDVAAAWSVAQLPTKPGKSTSQILSALAKSSDNSEALDAVVLGGVDPVDISSDALSQLLNTFVLSLEISHSAVTAIADVVLPVAAVVEKSGTYLDWQGRGRSFEKGIEEALSRSDVRILSMLADELGAPINLPTVAATAREISALGDWDGAKADFVKVPFAVKPIVGEKLNLTSWRLLLDLGTLQEGEANLAGTARSSAAHVSSNCASKLGVVAGDLVKISSDLGSITLPVLISEMSDDEIWTPRNSIGSQVIPNLGFTSGLVTVVRL